MALASDCISRADLRDLAIDALRAAATVAGDQVYGVHNQPMDPDTFPMLLVATPAERKDTAGDGAPQFLTTITLAIMARTAAGGEVDTELQLERLVDQVQQAILCSPDVVAPVQRFEFVETLMTVSVEGEKMVGEATIMFGCVVQQLYEPDAGAPLLGFHTTIPSQDDGSPVTFDTTLPQ